MDARPSRHEQPLRARLRGAGPTTHDVTVHDDGTTSNDDRLGAVGDLKLVIDDGAASRRRAARPGRRQPVRVLAAARSWRGGARSRSRRAPCRSTTSATSSSPRSTGSRTTDAGDRIVRFVEKPSDPASTLASTLIYLLPPEHVAPHPHVPRRGPEPRQRRQLPRLARRPRARLRLSASSAAGTTSGATPAARGRQSPRRGSRVCPSASRTASTESARSRHTPRPSVERCSTCSCRSAASSAAAVGGSSARTAATSCRESSRRSARAAALRRRGRSSAAGSARDAGSRFASARAAVGYDEAARRLVHAWKERGLRRLAAEAAQLVAERVAAARGRRAHVRPGRPHPAARARSQPGRAARARARARSGSSRACRSSSACAAAASAAATAAERRTVRGAFRATGPAPRKVAVVDDVYTTGATAAAAATTLRAAGARRVEVVAFARALRRG